jgi:MoxR-like ATPase
MTQFLPFGDVPPDRKPVSPFEFPPPLFLRVQSPSGYLPDKGLADAVNVALLLGQPLLVTGEPGTGKTQLAAAVAFQLGLEDPLLFETKSTTIAKDLFYSFDNVGRFRSAQVGGSVDIRSFLSFNALGEAILRTQQPSDIRHIVPDSFEPLPPRRSVVLIDEIDKAPRDFPNDILNEIEKLFFKITEMGNVNIGIRDDKYRPILIMTSNSEKSLPEAFLRRCIFYSIPFPEAERLEQIILTRLAYKIGEGGVLLKDAISFLLALRLESAGLKKKPGTAEILNWLAAIFELGGDPGLRLKAQPEIVQRSFSSIAKVTEDQDRIQQAFAKY